MIPVEYDQPELTHTPRPKRGVRLRFGPVSVPTTAVAWGVSIAAHGAVLVVGLRALRRPDTPPSLELRLGDGGDGGGFFVAGAPPAEPGVPPGASLAAAREDSFTPPAVAAGGPEPETWDVDPPPPPGLAAGPARAGPVGTPSEIVGGLRGKRAAVGAGRGDGEGAGNGPGSGPGAGGIPGVPGVPGGLADGRLPAPVYPRESRLRGEHGTVVIEVDVAADGSIEALRVVSDSGFPRLADAALAAVRKARFRPVACRLRIPFNFRLRASRT